MLDNDSFMKFMHMVASVRETIWPVPYTNHFTVQLIRN